MRYWLRISLFALGIGAGLTGTAFGQTSAAQVHVVRKGETLSGIAQRNGVRISQLKRWNGLRGDLIRVGQRLALKEGPRERPTRKVDPLVSQFAAWEDSVVACSRRNGGYALVVNKTKRRMEVYRSGKPVTTFPVAISYEDSREMTDRQYPNDHHVKEGVFHLSDVAWSDRIAKWDRVWMRLHTVSWAMQDYVEAYGAAGKQRLANWEARNGPILTDQDVQAFNRAHRGKGLWRGLGIHGGGAKSDWTDGCIALDRKDIQWLYKHLRGAPNGGVGTPVAVVRF